MVLSRRKCTEWATTTELLGLELDTSVAPLLRVPPRKKDALTEVLSAIHNDRTTTTRELAERLGLVASAADALPFAFVLTRPLYDDLGAAIGYDKIPKLYREKDSNLITFSDGPAELSNVSQWAAGTLLKVLQTTCGRFEPKYDPRPKRLSFCDGSDYGAGGFFEDGEGNRVYPQSDTADDAGEPLPAEVLGGSSFCREAAALYQRIARCLRKQPDALTGVALHVFSDNKGLCHRMLKSSSCITTSRYLRLVAEALVASDPRSCRPPGCRGRT
jgi:hypothetical protein